MPKQTIYTVGGTVQAGAGIYIKRQADEELLELCRQGELAFILSSRQVGKSSLMTQTAEQLRKENVHSAIVDLSSIGTKVTQEEWYLGILNIVATDLNLKTDIFAWWTQYAGLGPSQRFFNFLRDVMLKEIKNCIVLFFDEIDTTLSIPFADDFFASVRSTYNARSTTPDFKRLSFVLVGVATPSDLISDENRTPFNIGHRVELNDFTLKEAMPLAQGLGEHAGQVLAWILDWSGGHPYLTQRLCAQLAKSMNDVDENKVAQAVDQLFLGKQGLQDNNLQFVRDLLVHRSPDVRKGMLTYLEIRSGKKVLDDERSVIKAHLKVSGIVKRQSGQLITRNRIYERAFDLNWIKENTPSAVPRRIMIGSALAVTLALLIAAYLAYQEYTRTDEERTARFETNFRGTNEPQARLQNLAGIFALKDKSFGVRAINLFNSLPQEEKLALFKPADSVRMQDDQVNLTLGVYQSLENTPEGNELLKAMGNAMKIPKPELANEINFWVAGREAMEKKDYYDAKSALTNAIQWNSENPALYYERAQLFIAMGEETYPDALDDLNKLIKLDPNRISAARLLIDQDSSFSAYWTQNQGEYPTLAQAVIIIDDKGFEMILIPAGPFRMGSNRDDFDTRPIHEVALDAFYMDLHEVTNSAYRACEESGVCTPPALNTLGGYLTNYYDDPQYSDYPVVYVNWFQSQDFCSWRDAHLPTEAQWEKAARGTSGRTYPWGESINCQHANYGFCTGLTSTVGSFPEGASPYGVHDLAGNVWEWVSDWYSDMYYETSPFSNPAGPATGQYRVLRGGSFVDDESFQRATFRNRELPENFNWNIGFRCARPE